MEANEAQVLLPEVSLKNEINLATGAYAAGKGGWDLALKSNGQLNMTDPNVESWKKKYPLPPDLANAPQIDREVMLKAMWTNARAHVQSASTLLQGSTSTARPPRGSSVIQPGHLLDEADADAEQLRDLKIFL